MRAYLAAIGLGLCAFFAVDSRAAVAEHSVDQYLHTGWTVGDGAPPDIWAMDQGPDGFLWLGTGAGFYRFDGINFERIRPAGDEQFLSVDITSVSARKPGEVWVGYYGGGVSRLKDGHLTNYAPGGDFPTGHVYGIAVEESGVVWAAAKQGLARYDGHRWMVVGKDWDYPASGAQYVMLSRDGTLWVATDKSIVCLRPHARRFQVALTDDVPRSRPAEAPDGTIWVSEQTGGIFPLTGPGGRLIAHRPPIHGGGSNAKVLRAISLLFDANGVLWATDADHRGIFRVIHPAALNRALRRTDIGDVFGQKQGLTSDIAVPLLADSERDVWVGTVLGLNRFRDTAFGVVRQLPDKGGSGYVFAQDLGGSILVANNGALFRVRGAAAVERVATFAQDLDGVSVSASGATWLAGTSRDWKSVFAARLAGDALVPVRLPSVGPISEISILMGDDGGGVLVGFNPYGIMRYKDGTWSPLGGRRPLPYAEVGHRGEHGQFWIGYQNGTVARIDHDVIRFFSARDGLSIGAIETIEGIAGDIWVGGERGLARFDGRRFQAVSAKRVAALSGISGVAASADGAIWINGMFGVVRADRRDLLRALRDPQDRLAYRLFDYRDSFAQQGEPHTALATADGMLWFATHYGVVTVDPKRLHLNARPPPVSILAMTADGSARPLDNATLPPGTNDVRIDFTAPSLATPELVRFRYRLDGVDKDWIDAGPRRQASFTNLWPGDYVFQVIAANGDGVWSTAGATLGFTALPTFFQTKTFYGLCIAALLLVLRGLHSLRLRQVTSRLAGRLEERLKERERIARELHDTLLQATQGLLLEFQAIANRIPRQDATREKMEHALETANTVLIEGRDRVHDLRGADEHGELAGDVEDMIADLSRSDMARCTASTRGNPRRLHPVIREEVLKITREALINALQHARARTIEVEIRYMRGRLKVLVRDDRVGIAAAILARGGREGHYGLVGMQERAERIHAVVTVAPAVPVGTAVELIVPARIAYAWPARAAGWLPRLRHLTGL
ncbi:MAG TPA: triple tyrosine motif-containing protein [Rhizomicrobium sp.]